MVSLSMILLLLALGFAGLSAINISWPRVSLISLALFCYFLSLVIERGGAL